MGAADSPPALHALVINLDRRQDRWTEMSRLCRSAGLEAERVPAVEMSPGWEGCAYSHLKCVQIAKDRGWPWVLILEDDAAFTARSIGRFRELLPYLWANRDKWERFNGGPTFPPDPPLRLMSAEPALAYAPGLAAHFGLIHAGAYEQVLRWTPEQTMIDVYYMALETTPGAIFRSIATAPHIAVQSGSKSDLAPSIGMVDHDYSAYFRYSERQLRALLASAATEVQVDPDPAPTELPPIHLINLDRSPDRLRRFFDRNAHLDAVTRFTAIDGRDLDHEAIVRAGYVENEPPYGPGTLANALSHIRLWEAAAEGRPITVFEDDVVVVRDFERKARAVLRRLAPDWDMVLWGYTLGPSFVWADLGVSKARLHCYGPRRPKDAASIEAYQNSDLPAAPLRLMHCDGVQGYSISARGARAALDYCLPLRKQLIHYPDAGVTINNTAIDNLLCGLYPEIKAYICIPPLLIPVDGVKSDRLAIDAERMQSTQATTGSGGLA